MSFVIKRAFVKSHRYWLSIALVLVVTGCSSSSTSSSSADNIKVEIEQILPGCKFESVGADFRGPDGPWGSPGAAGTPEI